MKGREGEREEEEEEECKGVQMNGQYLCNCKDLLVKYGQNNAGWRVGELRYSKLAVRKGIVAKYVYEGGGLDKQGQLEGE